MKNSETSEQNGCPEDILVIKVCYLGCSEFHFAVILLLSTTVTNIYRYVINYFVIIESKLIIFQEQFQIRVLTVITIWIKEFKTEVKWIKWTDVWLELHVSLVHVSACSFAVSQASDLPLLFGYVA